MNVLVIGSGGREHALVWKIKQSPKVKKVYCIPGNGGTSANGQNINPDDFDALYKYIKDTGISLIIIGPEAPLSKGIVDFLSSKGVRVFGPNSRAALLESSKVFSKDFMKKHGIPTAGYWSFSNYNEGAEFLKSWPEDKPVVVKADGLAAGKGVLICSGRAQAMDALTMTIKDKVFGSAGDKAIIEEFLEGEEASVQIFIDGESYSIMKSVQDHKRIGENDTGPNTGGMGAYSPARIVTEEMSKIIENEVVKPVMAGLKKENIVYKGVLYLGLMIDKGTPYVLEFNCRFGDPETQVVLPLLKTDLVEIADAVIDSTLDKIKIEWYNTSSVCVVLASSGYPGSYEKGKIIHGLDDFGEKTDVLVFHAGTKEKDGDIVTSGGRVLGITAVSENIENAVKKAYEAVSKIHFDGMYFRRDIGHRALKRK